MNSLEVFEEIPSFLKFRLRQTNRSVGFVPTMGSLHEGHKHLLQKSVEENDVTIASIFVNPTQFNDPNDFANYPQDLDRDIETLISCKVDALLSPPYEALYPDNYAFKISEDSFSKILCGRHREGHFDGVLTIVMKLLNLVNPTNAYFGEKDYQQLSLIKKMANAFFIKTEIVSCPTIREPDGLALSSRNTLLNPEERKIANIFPKILKESEDTLEARDKLISKNFDVEYLEEIEGRRFGCVKLGNVRLIDNFELEGDLK